MSRIRSIHPGLFTDEAFVTISDGAQIFYIGLLTEADDQGVFEWKPVTLKMRLRAATTQPVDGLLSELEAAEKIAKYEIAGRKFGAIRNFRKFQRPKSPNAIHPLPSEWRNYVGLGDAISESGDNEHPTFPTKEEKPPQMEEVGEGDKEDSLVAAQPGADDSNNPPPEPLSPKPRPKPTEHPAFAEFWLAYPSRGQATNPRKPAAEKFARAVAAGGDPAEIIRGVVGYAGYCRKSGKIGTETVKQAETFLRQEVWKQYANPNPAGASDSPAGRRAWGLMPALVAGSPEHLAAYDED